MARTEHAPKQGCSQQRSCSFETPADPATELADALLDGVGDKPVWESFLPMCRRALDADCVAILLEPRPGGRATPVVFASGVEGETIIDLQQAGTFAADRPDTVEIRTLEPAYRADLTLYAGLAIELADRRTMRLTAWWRTPRTPPAHAARLLAALVRPFKRAGRIFMRIVEVERRAAAYETVADHADIGVLLVSRRGRVQLCNAVARKMLERADTLEIRADRLVALDEIAHRALIEQIERAVEGQKAGSEHISMPSALGVSGEPDALTAIVYPGPRYGPARGPIRCSAIILLRDGARVPRIPAEHVGRLFHLTPAESLLATRMAGGASLTDIAASTGVKHNTLRSQLQAIYAKTGVKRQSELVRLICTSAAALS